MSYVVSAKGDGKYLRLEPRSAAGLTDVFCTVAQEFFTVVIRFSLAKTFLKPGEQSGIMAVVFPIPVPVAEYHRDHFISAIQEGLFRIFRKVLKWFGEIPAFVTGGHELSFLYHILHALPRDKTAVSDRIFRIDSKFLGKMEVHPKA